MYKLTCQDCFKHSKCMDRTRLILCTCFEQFDIEKKKKLALMRDQEYAQRRADDAERQKESGSYEECSGREGEALKGTVL